MAIQQLGQHVRQRTRTSRAVASRVHNRYAGGPATKSFSMQPLASARTVSFVLTADQERSGVFYRDVLGLPFLVDDGFAQVFALPGGVLRITPIEGFAPGAHPVLGWTVGDIRGSCAALKAKGLKMEIYEGMGQDEDGIWAAPDGRTFVCFFKDPDGNVLSLTQGSVEPA